MIVEPYIIPLSVLTNRITHIHSTSHIVASQLLPLVMIARDVGLTLLPLVGNDVVLPAVYIFVLYVSSYHRASEL